ncbi:MAG: HAMP domain-containing protein, partial [Azovibrio sp.]
MLDFLTSLSRAFRDSVLARLGLAMGALALLSFISILISTVIADSSSGKANAINLSGSMRMMSFRLLSEVQQPDKRSQVPATIQEYEHRLQNLEHIIKSRMADNETLMGTTAIVVDQWQSNIRPLAQAAAANDPEALTQIARDVPHFVEHINRIVWLIEEDLEERIRLLRVTQFVLLAVIIALSLVTSWMLRRLFVMPLAELLKASRTVSRGAFTARVAHVGNDELGQLGQAFNTMISEIANMYAHLEDKVEERTRELTRTNQTLELLYRTSQQLSASELGLDNIQNVLVDIQRELELGHSMICIRENGHLPARPILGNLRPEERDEIHSQQDCAQCLRHAQTTVLDQQIEVGGRQLVILPIGDTDQLEGALSIFAKSGEKLPREKLRILKTVGLHISNALSNMQRAEEKHRLAVL